MAYGVKVGGAGINAVGVAMVCGCGELQATVMRKRITSSHFMECLLLAVLASHHSRRSEPRGDISASHLDSERYTYTNATVMSGANIPQSATVDYMRRGHLNVGAVLI